ncbi:MAG: M20/M25/M40 family metallo-hydrolase [Candidatus Eisenbacteria bacterium]
MRIAARRVVPRLVATTLILLAAAGAAPAAGLDPLERRLTEAVDRHATESLALVERAVNINSGTLDTAGVAAVARLFAPEFARLGFTTRWVDGRTWQRAGHLIATREGRPGAPRVLLIGHLDTVFEADSPFQHFQRTSDSIATGPGVIDMKGGDVVMLLALRALADEHALDRVSVTVFLCGDEERNGSPLSLARADLIAAAHGADLAIGFEDGDGDPRHVIIARRGASEWTLRTAGTPSHSSQIFTTEVGAGAVFEMARVLAAFQDSLAGEPYLTFNPGLAVGGTTIGYDRSAARGTAYGKNNVVAESSLVTGDLRTLSLAQREHAKEVMRRIVAASPSHASASITFDDGYPPFSPTDGNRRLLALADRASRDLGLGPLEPVDPARAGAADVAFTDGITPMAIDAMGMKGDGGHTVNEWALLGSLPMQAKRTAVLLVRLQAAGVRSAASRP